MEFACGYAVVRPPGEPDGRHVLVVNDEPFGAALLSNTPWRLHGESMPKVMSRAAEAVLKSPEPRDGPSRLRKALEYVDAALRPFSAPASDPDSQEARWDLGGDAGLVVLDDGLHLARVGDVRVLIVAAGELRLVLREHTLEMQYEARGTALTDALPRNVITACLGAGHVPPDAIAEGAVDTNSTVVLGSSKVLTHVQAELLLDAVEDAPSTAAFRILDCASMAMRDSEVEELSGSVAVFRRSDRLP
jgi:serine/threonine protein phosphatase PrpC